MRQGSPFNLEAQSLGPGLIETHGLEHEHVQRNAKLRDTGTFVPQGWRVMIEFSLGPGVRAIPIMSALVSFRLSFELLPVIAWRLLIYFGFPHIHIWGVWNSNHECT